MSLSDISGTPLTDDLGRYLGVLSVHERVNIDSFGSVMDRINAKLEGWKSRFLSLAG